MTEAGWTFIFLFIGMVIIFIGAFYYDYFRFSKEEKAKIKKSNEEFEAELKKPPYIIEFQTAERVNRSTEIKAYRFWDDSQCSTAKSMAEHELKRSYERGYFTDSEGMTYPVCNVVWARIKETV